MGKSKADKKGDGIQQRHIHSRLSFLHQAATYLANKESTTSPNTKQSCSPSAKGDQHLSQSRQLLSQFQEVSRKTQIRVTPEVKRTICKRCQNLLIAGSTSQESIVNASRGELKSWADVFEIRCNTCSTVKRFPIGQPRQKGKNKRSTAQDRPVAAEPRS